MFDALDREFRFVIDVCANRSNAKCARYFGPDAAKAWRDGLIVPWRDEAIGVCVRAGLIAAAGRNLKHVDRSARVAPPGAVFMNPPYSREKKMPIEPWIEKAAHEAMTGLVVVGIVPASVQTEWWYQFVRNGPARAHEIRFLPHRVSFNAPKGYRGSASNAGGNTAVVIWRPANGLVGTWQPAERYWTFRETNVTSTPIVSLR
jgi:hypothetical protein